MGRHDSHQRDRVPLPLWGVDGGRGGVEDAAGFVDIIRVNDEGNARHLQRRVNTTAVVGAHKRLDVRGLQNGLRETGLNGTQERTGDNKMVLGHDQLPLRHRECSASREPGDQAEDGVADHDASR